MTTVWTEGMVDLLCREWADGVSAALIASRISLESGHAVSRCAVIGKARRLKLNHRRTLFTDRKPATPRIVRAATTRAPARTRLVRHERPVSLSGPVSPPDPIDLMALTSANCHWPIGHGLYCGRVAVDGKSYCVTHHATATVPQRRGMAMNFKRWR